jgi:hypothetical protein
MRAFAAHRGVAPEDLTGRILCHDAGDLRKGHTLCAEDLVKLFAGRDEVHLLELGPDDIGQTEASQRLAEALRSCGVVALPSGHRHVLRATKSGLLDVDAAALQRMNAIPGVAVYTRRGGDAVDADQVIAHAQITPLAIGRPAIEEAERIAREQPLLRIRPFVPRDAVLWKHDDRLVLPLTDLLRRFGCELRGVLDLPGEAAAIRAAFLTHDAPLVLIAGANALDPLDPVFVALEALGATMLRRGMPVHPGTLLWIATRGDTTIVGLPPCGLNGAFELVLPRLLAGDVDFSDLGYGGELSSAAGGRRQRASTAETAPAEPIEEAAR